jgi:hypothetical protein
MTAWRRAEERRLGGSPRYKGNRKALRERLKAQQHQMEMATGGTR